MSFFLWALKNLPRAQPCNTLPAMGRAFLEACAVRYHWAGVADSQETTFLIPGLKELHVPYQLAAIPVFVAWLSLGLCLCAVLCSMRTSCWRLDWKPVNPKAGISEGPPGYVCAVSVSFKQTNKSSFSRSYCLKSINFCNDIFILCKIEILLNSFSKQKQS